MPSLLGHFSLDLPLSVKMTEQGPIGDQVARCAVAAYEKLRRKGKPGEREWTCLAALVSDGGGEGLRCEALATGTKCRAARDERALVDSHAEVLCRRVFQRRLLELSEGERARVAQRPLHLYISEVPCGAAREVQATTGCGAEQEESTPEALGAKRKSTAPHDASKRPRRMPAGKYLPGPHRLSYKPGKGQPSLSFSCSDKIAFWLRAGVQGRRGLAACGRAVHLSSVTVGRCADVGALRAALLDRFGSEGRPVRVDSTPVRFPADYERGVRERPSGSAFNWAPALDVEATSSANGTLLGVGKKHQQIKYSRLCRKSLQDLASKLSLPEHPDLLKQYGDAKALCLARPD